MLTVDHESEAVSASIAGAVARPVTVILIFLLLVTAIAAGHKDGALQLPVTGAFAEPEYEAVLLSIVEARAEHEPRGLLPDAEGLVGHKALTVFPLTKVKFLLRLSCFLLLKLLLDKKL